MKLMYYQSDISKRLFIFTLIVFSFFLMRFSGSAPTDKIGEVTQTNAIAFKNATDQLSMLCTKFQVGKATQEELKEAIINTRLAYKRIEFLLEYYYPEYVEENINGAPLMQLERYSTRPNVKPPQGLQTLDELIFSDQAEKEKTEITTLAQQLKNDYGVLYESFKNKKVREEEVIEAMRMELVRIFSMGITGFDTPGSVNALPEAKESMAALQLAAAFYLEVSKREKQAGVNRLFSESIAYLNTHNDFDSFDRLDFLKDFVDPLYEELEGLSPNSEKKTRSPKMGWNPKSNSIFGSNFLDPYFYTQLRRTEDSEAKRSLGQKIFYDKLLSQNQQMSCSSCHDPAKAFTDGQAKSLSKVEGKTVQRNAPTLLNAVYSDRYFYDLRAFSLEQQAEHVIFNHMEFNTAYEEITKKIDENGEYDKLVKKAFGRGVFGRGEFTEALASYVLTLQSFNSEFDRYVRGEVEQINPQVKKGFNLFMGKAACATCHFAPTFAGLVPPRYTKNESEILGVLEDPKSETKKVDSDGGRLASNMYSELAWIYEKSFKTSTVRNVKLTGPYFHNGAYETLEEVVDFYDHGGGLGLGLEVVNQTLPADSLNLEDGEKEALVAFMKSLTDNSAGKQDY